MFDELESRSVPPATDPIQVRLLSFDAKRSSKITLVSLVYS